MASIARRFSAVRVDGRFFASHLAPTHARVVMKRSEKSGPWWCDGNGILCAASYRSSSISSFRSSLSGGAAGATQLALANSGQRRPTRDHAHAAPFLSAGGTHARHASHAAARIRSHPRIHAHATPLATMPSDDEPRTSSSSLQTALSMGQKFGKFVRPTNSHRPADHLRIVGRGTSQARRRRHHSLEPCVCACDDLPCCFRS